MTDRAIDQPENPTTNRRRFLLAALSGMGGLAVAAAQPASSGAQTQSQTPKSQHSSQHPQTQLDLDMVADNEFKAADAKLNATYKRLMAKLDKQSQAKLKATQRTWIAFRDGESDFHADALYRGGSIEPMDYSGTQRDLTKKRTQQLEQTLQDLSH